jgi:tryptophanyl-tRNA synthetase
VIPDAAVPAAGARVMDLQHPTRKMSKSVDSPLGTVGMLDAPDEIRHKVRRAVTDTDGEMRFDRERKPGLANLLEILAAATDRRPEDVAAEHGRYGELKDAVTDALVAALEPVRERHVELVADPAGLADVLRKGADKARGMASPTLARAREAVGLLAP